jgi:hypothetical protein
MRSLCCLCVSMSTCTLTHFCLCIRCRGKMFTEPLPRNARIFWVHYPGFKHYVTLYSEVVARGDFYVVRIVSNTQYLMKNSIRVFLP